MDWVIPVMAYTCILGVIVGLILKYFDLVIMSIVALFVLGYLYLLKDFIKKD